MSPPRAPACGGSSTSQGVRIRSAALRGVLPPWTPRDCRSLLRRGHRGSRRGRPKGRAGGLQGSQDLRHLQALPHPLAHWGGPGRDVRGSGQRGGGLPRVARLRHREGRGLSGRPAGGQLDVPGGDRRGHRARALGVPVQPDPGRKDRPAPVRRAHPQPRRGARQDVRFFNEFYVLDLIMTEDGRCAGVVAYELSNGEIHVFRAKAVLFATGGYGKIFKVTSNAHTLTGDGPAINYRRGIPLEDMEFFQFHPTGIYKMGILISEAVRGEGGILINSDGERFMERYAPTIKDLAPRDMISRAIYQEI